MSDLDTAWAAAEKALPEGWDLELGTYHDDRYWAAAYGPEVAGRHAHEDGFGPTPVAALEALVTALRPVGVA